MYTERVIFIIFAPVFSNTNMLQPKSLALFLGLMMASATCLAQGTNIRTTHVVQQGETLYHIAKTYNVSVDDILSVNPTLSPDKYFVGMYINIPNSPALQAIQNDINGVEEHTTAVPNRVQAAVILPFRTIQNRKIRKYKPLPPSDSDQVFIISETVHQRGYAVTVTGENQSSAAVPDVIDYRL